MLRLRSALVAVALVAALSAHAQAPDRRAAPREPQTATSGLPPLPADKTTRHTIDFGGRTLVFDATAGSIKLNDPSGQPSVALAVIAYRLADGGADRPVTFVFNGGPGYASGWLQLGGLGPWRLPMDGAAAVPSAPTALLDNPATWLDFTDLVFVDPPGTGYSRFFGGDDVKKSAFSVNGDVQILSAAIRRWLTEHDRLGSPVALAGESYGGFRVPKITHVLQTVEGVGVRAMVMISPVLDFAALNGSGPMKAVALLPSYAATQMERTSPLTPDALVPVEAYAAGDYLADLLRGPRDPAALQRLTDHVAMLAGLDPVLVKRTAGMVGPRTFARENDRDDQTIASLYDATVEGLDPEPDDTSPGSFPDQLREGLHAPISTAMTVLLRTRLQWPVENARYVFFNEEAGRSWDYGRRQQNALGDLRQALALDPALKALVAHGMTDIVTPYFETKLELAQLPAFAGPDRVRLKLYPGGHMVYIRDASRRQLHDDARSLIAP